MLNKKQLKNLGITYKRYKPKTEEERRERTLDIMYRKNYGISLEDYEIILVKQGGVCGICFCKDKNKRLAVDHCHKTGKIRGLLCNKCNIGIGYFDDNIENLIKAANYLRGFDV